MKLVNKPNGTKWRNEIHSSSFRKTCKLSLNALLCECKSPWSLSESPRTCALIADVHRHWAAYWGWLIFHRLSSAVLEEVTLPKTQLGSDLHASMSPQRRPFNTPSAFQDINKEIHYKNKHLKLNKIYR